MINFFSSALKKFFLYNPSKILSLQTKKIEFKSLNHKL